MKDEMMEFRVSEYCGWLKRKGLNRAYIFKPELGTKQLKRFRDIKTEVICELKKINHEAEIVELEYTDFQFMSGTNT